MSDYEQQVRAYLADCARVAAELQARGSALDPKYHPTEAGVVKCVPHGGDATKAKQIRAAFAEALAGRDEQGRAV